MDAPILLVLAGPNGGGKSSIGGAYLRSVGLDYYDAEDFARGLQPVDAQALERALSLAWHEGRRRLQDAVRRRRSFAIETTLGGTTLPSLVDAAADRGFHVHIWYFGLDSAVDHVRRAATRQAMNGIAIPADLINTRWTGCRENLLALLPKVMGLRLFDNSTDRDPTSVITPPPRLLLDLRKGGLSHLSPSLAASTPDWAKPLIEAALTARYQIGI